MDFLVIDAFADQAFAGNPAAVVRERATIPDPTKQKLAMEFNQAETAFVRRREDGRFELRWFTPVREVTLCGHATLGAAHALWEWGDVPEEQPVRFVTRWSGELVCTQIHGLIAMDFPATPARPAALPENAAQVLGVEGPVACVGTAEMNLTLRLKDETQVRRARPDLATLAQWHPIGVTITAPGATAGVDFVLRFFAPAAGVPEDPVTGSAHCSLAPYWARELGKTSLIARQLSARGGELYVTLKGDRVELRGRAVTVLEGRLRV